jgi:hypothetical protein
MTVISAKVICDSTSPNSSRLVTFELDYPRIIHAELLTHKMLSKNSQSSRAVPVSKTAKVNKEFFTPVKWGKNITGMQSSEELTGWRLNLSRVLWNLSAKIAFGASSLLNKLGLHKQWANRITEPFSNIKVVVSGTEWDNFFWLRIDDAAQPEIQELAGKMKSALDSSKSALLSSGQWHIPYVKQEIFNGQQVFVDADNVILSIENALKISASCCAQVSYRNLDESLKKALDVFNKLFSSSKPHYSPTEHQGRVMKYEMYNTEQPLGFHKGVSNLDKNGYYWSANFKGFVQYRKLLEEDENNDL